MSVSVLTGVDLHNGSAHVPGSDQESDTLEMESEPVDDSGSEWEPEEDSDSDNEQVNRGAGLAEQRALLNFNRKIDEDREAARAMRARGEWEYAQVSHLFQLPPSVFELSSPSSSSSPPPPSPATDNQVAENTGALTMGNGGPYVPTTVLEPLEATPEAIRAFPEMDEIDGKLYLPWSNLSSEGLASIQMAIVDFLYFGGNEEALRGQQQQQHSPSPPQQLPVKDLEALCQYDTLALSNAPEGTVCLLCDTNIRSVTLVPCGHFVSCAKCTVQTWNMNNDRCRGMECTLCRTPVTSACYTRLS